MFYVKRKHYAGRWIVRIVQAALIFGIIFYGLDMYGQWMQSQNEPEVVVEQIEPVQPEIQVVQVITIHQTVVEQPQLDQYDYFRLGYEHQVSDEYYDAIADYSRSIELDPALAPSYLNRGVAYEQLGNNEYRAMVDFKRWMTRDDMMVLRHVPLSDSTDFTETMFEGFRYDVPLNLEEGEIVNLSAVSLNEDQVDPIIVLVDAYGNPVAANDDVRRSDGSLVSMNSYISQYAVERSGQYTLMVSHAGGGSYGQLVVGVDIDQ